MNVIVPQYIKSPKFFTDNPTVKGYSKLISVQYGSDAVLPEPTTSIWNNTTTYAIDDTVYYMTELGTRDEGIWKQYKAIAENTGQTPPEYSVDEYWLDLGAIEKYKAFDYYVSTTSQTSEAKMTIVFECSNITSIALINTTAKNATITGVSSTGETVIDEELQIYVPTTNYTDYFFKDFEYTRNIAIPINQIAGLFSNITVTIELEGFAEDEGNMIKCGTILPGRLYNLGILQAGVSTGYVSYAKIIEDETFGETYLKKGDHKNTLDCDLIIYNENKNLANNIVRQLIAVPTIFQGNEDDMEYDDLLLFGYIQDARVSHQASTYSEMALALRGML